MHRASLLVLSTALALCEARAQWPSPPATGSFSTPLRAPLSPIDPPPGQAEAPRAASGSGFTPLSGLDGAPASPQPPASAPPPKAAKTPITRERVVSRSDKRPSVYPGTTQALDEAIARYRAIAAAGGWPRLPAGIVLRRGASGAHVVTLRQRLAAEGDLTENTASPTFDAALVAAVKQFQGRHGQSQNGLVSGPTLKALRVSAEERLRALEQSAQRFAAHNFGFGPRYVVVNIPSASVEAIENDAVGKRFAAVVGKPDRASPEAETRITNINLNPTWTVPISLVKRDIIPHMRKDSGYLAKMRIRIYGASGAEINPAAIDWNTERAADYTLRQDSGTANSLGQMRIDMPNSEAVYMHDTPSKGLFSRDDRFYSSGCVRVENVRDFAAWLLEPTKIWDRAAIETAERRDIRPRDPVPVIWTYLTAFVTPDGQVHFRPDVYGYDSGTPTPAVARASKRKAPVAPPAEAGKSLRDFSAVDPIRQLLEENP